MPDFEHGPARDPLHRLSELAASGRARAQAIPAEQVRALGARRHRRRVAATVVAASVAVALMAGGVLAASAQLDHTSRTPQPVDSPPPSLAPHTPTGSEKVTPGSRPGLGGTAFERRGGKGAEGSPDVTTGTGNQPSVPGAGSPNTQPTPHPGPPSQDPPPVDRSPVDPSPVDPSPVDPSPVDPSPVDPSPVDPSPDDPSPDDPPPDDPPPDEPAPQPDPSTTE